MRYDRRTAAKGGKRLAAHATGPVPAVHTSTAAAHGNTRSTTDGRILKVSTP